MFLFELKTVFTTSKTHQKQPVECVLCKTSLNRLNHVCSLNTFKHFTNCNKQPYDVIFSNGCLMTSAIHHSYTTICRENFECTDNMECDTYVGPLPLDACNAWRVAIAEELQSSCASVIGKNTNHSTSICCSNDMYLYHENTDEYNNNNHVVFSEDEHGIMVSNTDNDFIECNFNLRQFCVDCSFDGISYVKFGKIVFYLNLYKYIFHVEFNGHECLLNRAPRDLYLSYYRKQ